MLTPDTLRGDQQRITPHVKSGTASGWPERINSRFAAGNLGAPVLPPAFVLWIDEQNHERTKIAH